MRDAVRVEKFDKRVQAIFEKVNAQRFHASSKYTSLRTSGMLANNKCRNEPNIATKAR